MEFQGKKQTIFCLSFVTFCLLGDIFAQSNEELMHYDNNPLTVEEVRVGVILDMQSREGKIVLGCISTALSDFYHLHNNYSTRVVLHSRDSSGKHLHALSAALDLLNNIKVEAIIGAQTRMEANLLADLGEDVEVPILSLSQPSLAPPLTDKNPFFVEVTQDETLQVTGITALIEIFTWRNVILLYEMTNHASDIIPSLINSFQEKNVYISYISSISVSSTTEQIIEELQKLKALDNTVFVVHISHFLVPRLFMDAKKLGMMSEGYAWILTSTSLNFLNSMDSAVIESMQGVLGLKSHIPTSRSLHNLTSRLRRKLYIEESHMEVLELSADAIWAYDSTWILAEAVERSRIKISTSLNRKDLNDIKSSKPGSVLREEILQSRVKGLSGEIQYPKQKLIADKLEIVNVIGKGERRIGILTFEEEKTKESQSLKSKRNLLSTSDLETVIWPGGSSTITKGSKRKLSETKLRVGVPPKRGFEELVHVKHDFQTNKTYFTGFCIDVFETAIRGLPYKVQYEFIPFENANELSAGRYNDLVYQVYLQVYDAVVGDTTITSNRSLYVDFTVPYSDLGVGMLVANEKENMWIFLRPLSADLWMTSAGLFMLTGFVVWVIERPTNTEFQGTLSQQIGTIFWFSFSTLVFAHREKLLNNSAKFVVVIWVFVVLILTSSYTATLASMMTVKQMQLNAGGHYIGYQSGSFITANAVEYLNFSGAKPYRSVEAYADALSRGSKHGGVSAIVDEVPYIKVFLAKYSEGYSMIKTESTTNGFGFAFPKGSKLAQDMSTQIEKLREEGKLLEMEKAWFHYNGNHMSEDTTSPPNTLNLSSFCGLFLVTGVSSAFALFLFIISPLREKWQLVKKCRYLIQGFRINIITALLLWNVIKFQRPSFHLECLWVIGRPSLYYVNKRSCGLWKKLCEI
ncbi:glutamate receptor 1.4 isoform X2 [Rosa chinensis]|uniref:glutamate receptor 1.4 isoform X2 n=1 Tax=Rosa chinensis TaxID=74649 RepID=UPI001AD91B05|nr:glutamate receptor 1.4 isoform X2 [Rosa chinensis]